MCFEILDISQISSNSFSVSCDGNVLTFWRLARPSLLPTRLHPVTALDSKYIRVFVCVFVFTFEFVIVFLYVFVFNKITPCHFTWLSDIYVHYSIFTSIYIVVCMCICFGICVSIGICI